MKKNGKSFLLVLLLLTTIINSQVTNDNQFNIQDLVNNQPISVTIGGEFIVTGSFPAYSGERVDQFITRIFNEARNNLQLPVTNEKLFLQILSKADEYSLRGITLKRVDGTEITLDLLKFRLTGNFDYNPYLKNDDVIIFPKSDLEYNFIEINGAVNKPTKLQFVVGDKLQDAIFFARGISQAYENVDSAIISRLSYDGKKEEIIKVSVNENVNLKRGDRIKLVANQPRRKSYKVLVLGEVNKPGYVFITENNTSLKEVINKAGGFTAEASLQDAEIVRNLNRFQTLMKYAMERKGVENPLENLPVNEDENEYWLKLETLRMFRTSDLMYEDSLYFNVSNQLRILEGTNIVDFSDIYADTSTVGKFIVKDGDVIIIPEKFEAVYVFGQVGAAGYYKYSQGKDYSYYINQAGGLTGTAKSDDEIFVIKGKSREWISIDSSKDFTIEPGDYIYVLKDIPRDMWYYIGRIGTIAGILGSIATIVLLFKK